MRYALLLALLLLLPAPLLAASWLRTITVEWQYTPPIEPAVDGLQLYSYTAGGTATTVTTAEVSGTMTVQGTQVVFTATGAGIGPFRYAILYNDSATAPAKAAIAFWDYGSSITLNDTETFTVKFSNASPGTIFTLA